MTMMIIRLLLLGPIGNYRNRESKTFTHTRRRARTYMFTFMYTHTHTTHVRQATALGNEQKYPSGLVAGVMGR